MINDYNAQVRELVGAELKKRPDLRGFRWMMKKTGYIPEWLPPKNTGWEPGSNLFLLLLGFLSLCLVEWKTISLGAEIKFLWLICVRGGRVKKTIWCWLWNWNVRCNCYILLPFPFSYKNFFGPIMSCGGNNDGIVLVKNLLCILTTLLVRYLELKRTNFIKQNFSL